MRSLLFAAAAVVLAATPVWAADRSCQGSAEGANDGKVDVTFTVDDKGAITKREAEWTPPAKGGGQSALALLAGGPMISISYGQPTADGLGGATSISASTMSMAGAKPYRGAVIAMVLDGDGAHEWSGSLMIGEATSERGKPSMAFIMGELADAAGDSGPVNKDLLAAVEKASSARVGFRAGSKVVGRVNDVEMADRAGRDALFHKAWDAAAAASANPGTCAKVK
jgi:hypothetical protein